MTDLIRIVERHCNNYFNPRNDPNSPERNHPPEFLELVEQIGEFIANPTEKKSSVSSETIISLHQWSKGKTASGVPVGWQQVFASDLAQYKRARFI